MNHYTTGKPKLCFVSSHANPESIEGTGNIPVLCSRLTNSNTTAVV